MARTKRQKAADDEISLFAPQVLPVPATAAPTNVSPVSPVPGVVPFPGCGWLIPKPAP